jgi:hypothetical protein
VLSSVSAAFVSVQADSDANAEPIQGPYSVILTYPYNWEVEWNVNGIEYGAFKVFAFNHGDTIKVNAKSNSEQDTKPHITANGRPYEAGSEFIVTDNTVFAAWDTVPEQKQYIITLSNTEGIEWTVGSVVYGVYAVIAIDREGPINVDATVLPGYAGKPILSANKSSYVSNAPFTLTGDTTFEVFGIVIQKHNVTLQRIEGIEWNLNGTGGITSVVTEFKHGESVKIGAKVIQGYTGTPVFTVNKLPYVAGTAFTVTGDATFAIQGITELPKYTVTLPKTEDFEAVATSESSSLVTAGSPFSFVIIAHNGHLAESVTPLANNIPVLPFEGVYTIQNVDSDLKVTLIPAELKKTVTVIIDADDKNIVFHYKVDADLSKRYTAPFQVKSGAELKLTATSPNGTVVWPDGQSSIEYTIKDISKDTKIVVNHQSSPNEDEEPENEESPGGSDPISPVQEVLVVIGIIISIAALIQLRIRRA